MENIFSDRIKDVPRSFIREILKVSIEPDIISFAGGLPNRELFPTADLETATEKVFSEQGTSIFQYSNSEGLIELRTHIAKRYKKVKNIIIAPEDILITNGGQQGLDLIGKVLLNSGDGVIIEEPGYLGAIQAFSIFRPQFYPVRVNDDGMDLQQLNETDFSLNTKLMYTVPNFQNPSGITYTEEVRQGVAEAAKKRGVFIIEDDPYGELRFSGRPQSSFYELCPENTILLGSFSKVVIPGFRLGWVVAPEPIRQKLLVAKQAADLHTCNFTQSIMCAFLEENDLDIHVEKIIKAYGQQCKTMMESIDACFPKEVQTTRPEGGMFLWGRLPEQMSSMALFDRAVEEKVVFVPGDPFYTNRKNTPDFRLNFSCVDPETIEVGIKRLGRAISEMLK